MAAAHLIHGYLGSGKTTFAKQLAADTSAVYVSLDEWYLGLFTDGHPTGHQDYDSLQRLLTMLDSLWPRILEAGTDVVLDFGYWTRAGRDDARFLADQVGADARLYWIWCDPAVGLRRCLARNEHGGASFVIDVDAYSALTARFEKLDTDELHTFVDTSEYA